jgi:hypothetical protein
MQMDSSLQRLCIHQRLQVQAAVEQAGVEAGQAALDKGLT